MTTHFTVQKGIRFKLDDSLVYLCVKSIAKKKQRKWTYKSVAILFVHSKFELE